MFEKRSDDIKPLEGEVLEKEIERVLREMAAFYNMYLWIKPAETGEEEEYKMVSVEYGEEARRCPTGCPDLFEEILWGVQLHGAKSGDVTRNELVGRFEAMMRRFQNVVRVEVTRGHLGKHVVSFDPFFEDGFGQPALKASERRFFEKESREYTSLSMESQLGAKLAEVFGDRGRS